jgi:hypothetical protein
MRFAFFLSIRPEDGNMLALATGASLPQACGDGTMLKAAYRFFDNREEWGAFGCMSAISRSGADPGQMAGEYLPRTLRAARRGHYFTR